MTDKQIKEVFKNGFYCIEPCPEIKELLAELSRKEQECEELKDKLNCCFCNPYVELNNIEKQRKCVEVTECFRQQLDQLKAENEELKKIIERLDVPKHEVIDMDIALENERLKAELQRYKDMETKGLEEFKDVGGCWGCGIQSSLYQMQKDYTELKAQNVRLINKGRMECLNCEYKNTKADLNKLKQTLTEIKEIAEDKSYIGFWDEQISKILEKISEVLND